MAATALILNGHGPVDTLKSENADLSQV